MDIPRMKGCSPMSLGDHFRALTSQVDKMEASLNKTQQLLNNQLDLYNLLTNWITETDHDDAAQEISNLLEFYLQSPTLPMTLTKNTQRDSVNS